MQVQSLELARNTDLATRGSSAIELVQRVAETIASAEARLEQLLQKALAEVSAADDLGTALTERASKAEKRADEAEKWLRRLHAKLEEEFASANQVLARA